MLVSGMVFPLLPPHPIAHWRRFWTSGIGSSQVSGGVGQVTKDFLAFKTLLLEALIQPLLTFPTSETICRGFLTRVQLMGRFLVLYTLYTAYL